MHSKRRLSEAPAACYVKKLHMRPYVVTKKNKTFLLASTVWSNNVSNFRNTKTSNDASESKLLICATVTGI